ncbi:MAG: hypothetical protein JSV89_19240 [Spirochaetaceae bacterium]|nr:MAG: hypothetical protein JSV89_19240 [Spirochaetaceae bacterium]
MKKAVLSILMFLSVLGLHAQDVAEQELRSVDREIVFINYEGPYDRIDTADEIKGLGWYLANVLAQNKERASFLFKYSVIRVVDPKEVGKFDADIFSIDRDAKVDHIDNVRRILAGYLEGSFDYSSEDARTLARFATIYNAVYRGQLEYLSDKYKSLVLSYLTRQNAGLSTKYFEWPGATKMLIPLTAEAGKGVLGSLSTTELTEEKVIEEMRQQEDMGLEDRKDMVELKEREVEEKMDRLDEEKAELEEAKEELAESKEELERAQTQAERERLEAEVAAREREVREREAAAAETEAQIAAKEEEIAEEREQIIADERAQDRQPQRAGAFVFSDQLYYLKARPRASDGSITSTLHILDPVASEVQASSPVSHIRGRAFYFFKNSILVVGHESSATSSARLMLLEPLTLKETTRSWEAIYPESYVLLQSNSIYAVFSSGNEYRLGRFDEALQLISQSEEIVDRDSAFFLFGDKIYINSATRDILVLNREDLKRQGLIR